uniref:Deoxyribonuclease 1 like 4, tandem duplicate 1 n=1 Tax=Neogobius melanostomus TaxID=47308 RepID=A0A8C6U3B5_9GOBI
MKIASFNVQRFGLSKVSKPDALSTLVKVKSIIDNISGTSITVTNIIDLCLRFCTTHHYTIQLSARLGRSRYKEQLLFLYRDDVVTLIDSYQYEDNQINDEDAFAREPYILHFKPHNTVLKDIVLIPVHSTLRDSEKELDELYDVFMVVKDKWKTNNIMILGDFNADGAYVTNREMNEIRIRSDRNFHWLIGDDVDTTANTTNEHTYPMTAKPFNFHKEFSMTEEKALEVSDHYPVEVELLSSSCSQECFSTRGTRTPCT